MPGASGDGFDDVILGYDSAEEYLDNPDFYGALVGPSANRVKDGLVVIDGVTYQMDINNNANNLHTDHADGLHKRKWNTEFFEKENRVTFTIRIEDGTYHLPGNREFKVSYSLVDKRAHQALAKEEYGSVRIDYLGTSDKDTLMNLTNHVYFNLNGHGINRAINDKTDSASAQSSESVKSCEGIQSGTRLKSITNHSIKLYASRFTPIDASLIPTGELRDVKGTVFDFDTIHAIAENIDADDEQLRIAGGFDHNFVLDGWKKESYSKTENVKQMFADNERLHPCASVYEPVSGRHIFAETTLPGVQFYSGNFMREQIGKYGCGYARRGGFCLETQYFPSAVSIEAFADAGYPKPIFSPDRPFRETTVYTFGRILES